MELSRNFTLEEMIYSKTARSLKISNEPNLVQIENLKKLCRMILQPIRERWGRPIKISSGYRSQLLNKKIGGALTSQHLNGEAADIFCQNNKELWRLIIQMIERGEITVGQLIDEENLSWIHISSPGEKHRNQILRIP